MNPLHSKKKIARAQSAFKNTKEFIKIFYSPAKELLRSGEVRRNARYLRFCETLPVDEKLVLFESFGGRGLLCGPYALFCEMLSNPQYADMKIVWVLDDLKSHADEIEIYSGSRNVSFVQYFSRDYLKALATAKYLINNVTFPTFFTKREGQIYINTWHGIPLKTLGYDVPNGAEAVHNMVRNFLHADYLISANPFLTDIYRKAYKMDGIYGGKIIEAGYPRLDTLVRGSREDKIHLLELAGNRIDREKKIAIYAPTWREGEQDPMQILAIYQYVKQTIEQANPDYQVLVKVHQIVYQQIRREANMADIRYLIPASIDANDVLPIADILISDYSSIFFDYLYFDRPVLFYIPDLERYTNDRGLYFPVDWLPGPYSKDLHEIAGWIHDIDEVFAPYEGKLLSVREWSCATQAGGISERILATIILGEKRPNVTETAVEMNKKKILFYRGRMRVNGISTSFINLLNQIDYEKYDVSTVINPCESEAETHLLGQINPNTRILMRKSPCNATYAEKLSERMITLFGLRGIAKHFYSPIYFQREAKRCFGDTQFDVALDFEGYNFFHALIVLNTQSRIKAIWQHNDMHSECSLKYPYLKTVFSLYPLFDRIVSCSKAIMEVNKEKLPVNNTKTQYAYAKNAIDAERIIAQSERGIAVNTKKGRMLFTRDAEGNLDPVRIPLNPGTESAAAQTESQKIYRFVFVGRLSVEKNVISLIRAFRMFLQKEYQGMLYLVGDGPLKAEVEQEIEQSDLTGTVIMTGNITNPYTLMKECDCFVLPSLHEGQPMVLLEARTLKLPILMTEFSSAAGSEIPNGQYIIGKDPEGILKGLLAFVNGEVPDEYEFDAKRYNQEAYQEFLHAVDLE